MAKNANNSQKLEINTPPEYEMKLLTALSFFLGRNVTTQAVACLSMYLRQSEPRIMSQVRYYASKISRKTGRKIDEYELLDLIFDDIDAVTELLIDLDVVHQADEQQDIFDGSSVHSMPNQL